jgi:hypothetical protein
MTIATGIVGNSCDTQASRPFPYSQKKRAPMHSGAWSFILRDASLIL